MCSFAGTSHRPKQQYNAFIDHACQAFFSAIITFEDHPEGTKYTATAMHKNEQDCKSHAEMGFMDGWSTALAQLADLAEG